MNTTQPDRYEPIESASIDELSAIQLQRLTDTLDHAYTSVAHYRQAFDAAGVVPADLRDLEDLARFPLLTKADLRDNYPFGLFAVPRSEVVRIHASSGTTGKPTVAGYTAGDIDLTRLLPGTARPMRRIARISGRSDDMLIVRGVNVFPSQIEAEVLKVDGLTPHFQIEVDRSGNLAQLAVRVERSPDRRRSGDELADELAGHIKGNIGVSVDVMVAEPGAVPRSAGKAQRVVPAK